MIDEYVSIFGGGNDMTDTEFINWIAARFVHVYGEPEQGDFVTRLRKIATRLATESFPITQGGRRG